MEMLEINYRKPRRKVVKNLSRMMEENPLPKTVKHDGNWQWPPQPKLTDLESYPSELDFARFHKDLEAAKKHAETVIDREKFESLMQALAQSEDFINDLLGVEKKNDKTVPGMPEAD